MLDAGGFPPVGPPIVYDYAYTTDRKGKLSARLTRTVDFAGNLMGFAEDVEVLPNGEYVVSESVFGGLWLIGRDGEVRPGIVPTDPAAPLPGPRRLPVPGLQSHRRRAAVRGAGELRAGRGPLAARRRAVPGSSTRVAACRSSS